MPFGQIVVGPPGAGKTVYCNGMQQFLNGIERKTTVVNLDPANDYLPYDCAINIFELVSLDIVMQKFSLGPNGGLMYCMEYLEANFDWLLTKLKALPEDYFLFDCPGQVELYTHHKSMRNILKLLEKEGFRITCVSLVDSFYCSSPTNYISAITVSLSTMLHLELPHVNVLSKIDLISKYGNLDFNLEYYVNAEGLDAFQLVLNQGTFATKYKKLTEAMCEVIEDFGLISFSTLDIQDKDSVLKLLYVIDKANGYSYSGLPTANAVLKSLNLEDLSSDYFTVGAVQEKYVSFDHEMPPDDSQ